jgi:recombination protein RecA
MAKRKKDEEVDVAEESKEMETAKLSKLLINKLNEDEEKKGKVAWSLATDHDNPTDVKEWISTGSTLLNYIISNKPGGGIPVGKLVEFSGEEASGKSLLCMHLAAEVQKRGGICVYLDTENALNPEFATQIGVDLTKLVYSQPGTVEEVGETIEKTINTIRQKAPNKLVLIVWDGIAATPTQIEIEGNMDLNMNQQLEKSKLLSKMMRKIMQSVGKQRIALVFTNQLKVKIGTMYGDPLTTPGGKAVPYHASVRVKLTRGNTEKGEGDEADDVMGVNTMAKIVKNRMGPPLRKCRFFISFARGIEDVDSWFNMLHERGAIVKKDGWCYIPEIPSGKIEEKGADTGIDRGVKFREKGWAEFVKADPKVQEWIKAKMEQLMVVKYGQMPSDAELDPESVMEAEQVLADLDKVDDES